jgi:hypothetical protein
MSEPQEDQMLRRYLRQEAPSVSADQGWLSMTSRLRARRIMRIARWPLFLVVLAGAFVWIAILSSGGCAPGVPELKASDLLQATVKVTRPTGGGAPRVISVDLTNSGERDKLLAAYRSMGPWRQERGLPPSPDLSLALTLTKDRQFVITLSRDNFPYVLLREYGNGALTGSVYLQPNGMYAFIVGFAR